MAGRTLEPSPVRTRIHLSFWVTHRPAVSLCGNVFLVSVVFNSISAEGILTRPTDAAAALSATACQEEQQEHLEQQQSTKKGGETKKAFAMARCVDREKRQSVVFVILVLSLRASNEIIHVTRVMTGTIQEWSCRMERLSLVSRGRLRNARIKPTWVVRVCPRRKGTKNVE